MKLLKELREQKAEKVRAMEEMLTREAADFNVEEIEQLKREVEEINTKIETIKNTEEMIKVKGTIGIKVVDTKIDEETRALEEVRAQEQEFFDVLSGEVKLQEVRTIGRTGNSVLIPTTIAKDIIEEVRVLSPAFAKCYHTSAKGNLSVIIEDITQGEMTAAFVAEGQSVNLSKAYFKNAVLSTKVAMAGTKINRSLMNNTDFDIRSYVIRKLAMSLAMLFEDTLFNGETVSGIKGFTELADNRKVKLTTSEEINVDALIDLECKVPTAFRSKCEFYVNPEDLRTLRKMKNTATGEYVLQRDLQDKFKFVLLGYPIHESQNIEKGKIYFADMSGVWVQQPVQVTTQVLLEKYAEENNTGIITSTEVDMKLVELHKLAMIEKAQA